MNNIDILNEMYKVVTMGIVGIDEVKDKILCRELKDIIISEKKVYPNDPCPCGSGLKYKQCCGRK